MSEHAILNEKTTWDYEIQDNICPDYGFGAKLPNTRVGAKAPGGQPFSRETQNSGHTFSLTWNNRSFRCVQRVRQFYDQYEDGYFTLIDKDGGGRHYVGRFTGEFNRVQNANDSYSIQGLTFEEVPGVPMLEYPNDWTNDSVALKAFNDFGTQLASTSGTWTAAAAHGFKTLSNAGTAVGDFVAMEYRGYGFELWMLKGPEFGQVEVAIDGTDVASVDLYSAADTTAQMVFRHASMPLDLHRVFVRMLGTKNGSATAAGAAFAKLQVMR